jgi:hypothetical protein
MCGKSLAREPFIASFDQYALKVTIWEGCNKKEREGRGALVGGFSDWGVVWVGVGDG